MTRQRTTSPSREICCFTWAWIRDAEERLPRLGHLLLIHMAKGDHEHVKTKGLNNQSSVIDRYRLQWKNLETLPRHMAMVLEKLELTPSSCRRLKGLKEELLLSSGERLTKENVGLLLNGARDLIMAKTRIIQLANAFFASFATDEVSQVSQFLSKEHYQQFESGITCESLTHPIPQDQTGITHEC